MVHPKIEWHNRLISHLRSIGVIVETCLGCGKIECLSCPAGTGTSVDRRQLSPSAAGKLKRIWDREGLRSKERGDWREVLVSDLLDAGVLEIVALASDAPIYGVAVRIVPSELAPESAARLREFWTSSARSIAQDDEQRNQERRETD